jgi:putative flippase GtrA
MERAIASALQLWQRFTITRYLVASAIALAFDVALFSSLVAVAFDPTLASAAGYCAGIVVHWMVSANLVFTGKARAGAALHIQRALFAGSALAGLGITVATVELLGRAGAHPIPSKAAAVAISFFAVYALRKWGVFR